MFEGRTVWPEGTASAKALRRESTRSIEKHLGAGAAGAKLGRENSGK